MQQNNAGMYVENPTRTVVEAGDRVRVEGSVNCGLHPSLHAAAIEKMGHAALPAPIPVTFTQLMQGKDDTLLVSMRVLVRSADAAPHSDSTLPGTVTLRTTTEGGPVDIEVHGSTAASLEPFLDAEVEVTGIAVARQDGKLERIGVVLYADSLANVRILKRAAADPWNLPPTAMDTGMSAYAVDNRTRRIRVHGSVTYVEPGQTVVLEDGPQSLLVHTADQTPLQVGDEVDAIGFPLVNDSFMVLTRAEFRRTGRQHPVSAQPSAWRELASGRHAYDLVSIEGSVVQEMHGAKEDAYMISADGNLFGALLRHQDPETTKTTWPRPAEKTFPVGARVRLTGVCFPIDSYNYSGGDLPFNIMLRSAADMVILQGPPLVNTRNLGTVTVLLLLVLVVVSARFWQTERRVRREMARLAYSERRRSRILEQINSGVALAEIVEQTADLVSFRLQGAACWVHIEGGADLGNQPRKLSEFRVEALAIPSRSGKSSGTINVALDHLLEPSLVEKETLAMAAGLIELAIETRKTYTDLVRRSEFDQLTNVQNRFSLERSMDQQIRQARASAGIFGLIYIDLNDFKHVNDLYGHQIGDRFLQEFASRMKRQLRPGDLLARLGGDEFAVLVPEIHSRAEAEEIATRMERCFDDPFQADGHSIPGSAAIGLAIYPEDGRSREALLKSADAAMYLVKHGQARLEDSSPKRAGAASTAS
jgi:diguanylate cyclase (GGDEF)-like protein